MTAIFTLTSYEPVSKIMNPFISLFRVLTTLLLFFSGISTYGQVIYLSTIENNLYTLDVESCSVQFLIGINATVYDISFHPDGRLYGLNGAGELYEINENTGQTSVIAQFDGQTFNSLTISGDEIAYAAGTNGTFASYNFKTDEITNRGNLGFNPTGDLTFFDGELYAACSNDRIIKVNIDAPSSSELFMQEELNKPIWGIVSYAEDCDDIKTYAVTGEESDIYLIDFNNKQLDLVCELGVTITGGASTSEFRESNPLALDSIIIRNPDCIGNGGIIEIIASGGSNLYTYTLNEQQESMDSIFTNLLSGEYIVTIFDGFCEVEDTVNIGFLNNLSVEEIIVTDASCNLENGNAVIVLGNMDPTLAFSLDDINYQSSSQFENLKNGNYSVYIQNDDGCRDSISFSIDQTGNPKIDSTSVNSATCEELNGSISISISGGTTPYEFSIDSGMNYQFSNLFSNLNSGTYTINVKDSNGCFTEGEAVVDRLGGPTIDSVITYVDYCSSGIGSIDIYATGLGNIEYNLSGNEYISERKFENLSHGSYNVSVKDSLGCETSIITDIKYTEPPTISNIKTIRSECNMANGSFTFDITNGQGELLYYLDDVLIDYPEDVSNLESGDYSITVIDSLGCQDETLITIFKEGCTVFIPNVFSPNADQHNDTFDITLQNGFEGEVISFNIYDRWGQSVYSLQGKKCTACSWDGTISGKFVSTGVYVYAIEVIHFDGKRELFKGDLTVLD